MRKFLIVFFVLIVLPAVGILLFHRPSAEQSKRAFKKRVPQSLVNLMKSLEGKKPRPAIKANRGTAKKPDSNPAFLEQSLQLLKNLLSAIQANKPPPSARKRSPGRSNPGASDGIEDMESSIISRLLNSKGTDLGEVLREILETGFSNETLGANRDLLEGLFPTQAPEKAKAKRPHR